MRIIAIIENVGLDENYVLAEKWLETSSFDASQTLDDVIKWAAERSGHSLKDLNVKLAVDQSSIEKK